MKAAWEKILKAEIAYLESEVSGQSEHLRRLAEFRSSLDAQGFRPLARIDEQIRFWTENQSRYQRKLEDIYKGLRDLCEG